MKTKTTAKENISLLPEYCFSSDNVTRKLIRIKAGESGFYPAHTHPEVKIAARHLENIDDLADRLNAEMGVTKAQREAMEIGSMWGWEVPGANPNAYNEDGSFKKEFLSDRN